MRGGGLTTLLFLLPMLLVFGAFSWYPIVRTVIMSLQHTNLVQAPTWVGLRQLPRRHPRPAVPDRGQEHRVLRAASRSIFGYPIPLVAAVLMSEVRQRRGLYSALAYLPVVIPPVVAVLLWKTFYDAELDRRLQHRSSAGSASGRTRGCSRSSAAMPSLVLESTWANAGGDGDHLPRRADRREPRALRGGLGRRRRRSGSKVWHITLPQLRGVLLVTMILQIIGTAQVFLEPYLFTSGGPANATLTVLLLIYDYAFGNSLGGDYGRRRRSA